MNAIEYDLWKEQFFAEYEKYVRKWLVNSDVNIYMANNMPFLGMVLSIRKNGSQAKFALFLFLRKLILA